MSEAEQFMDAAVAAEATSEVNNEQTEMDWDNIEETAPSVEPEEDSSESVESKDSPKAEVKEEVKDEEETLDNVGDNPPEADKSADNDASEAEESEEKGKALSIADMDDDALISVKVDGELQEISLKEFKSGISGQKAVAQKFAEVDRVHKQNQSDIKEINEYVNTFSSKMKEGSALEAMEYLSSFSGMGSHQIKASLIKALMPDIERMYGMDQSEIDLEYSQKENTYLTEQRERDSKLSEQRQAEENLNSQVREVRDSLKAEDTEWNDAIAYLDKHLEPEKAITPELVGEYVTYARTEKQAESLLSGIEGENLINDNNMNALQQIIMDNPEFTEEDLKDIVVESMAIAKKGVVEEKIEKVSAIKKSTATTKKKTKQEDQEFSPILDELGDEILDFADL